MLSYTFSLFHVCYLEEYEILPLSTKHSICLAINCHLDEISTEMDVNSDEGCIMRVRICDGKVQHWTYSVQIEHIHAMADGDVSICAHISVQKSQ